MSSGVVESFMRHYFLVTVFLTQLVWVVDIGRWAVRLGRYAFEKVSNAPKGWFKWDRDPL